MRLLLTLAHSYSLLLFLKLIRFDECENSVQVKEKSFQKKTAIVQQLFIKRIRKWKRKERNLTKLIKKKTTIIIKKELSTIAK